MESYYWSIQRFTEQWLLFGHDLCQHPNAAGISKFYVGWGGKMYSDKNIWCHTKLSEHRNIQIHPKWYSFVFIVNLSTLQETKTSCLHLRNSSVFLDLWNYIKMVKQVLMEKGKKIALVSVVLPDSEMSSQKGEWNAYSALMIFENRRVSLSSKNGG